MTDQLDLAAVAAEMALMRERVTELEAEVARLRSGPPPAAASAEPPLPGALADEPLGRRAALRKAGMMAAGAVAGGAALAATTASPAAAATMTGSGNPGVSAQGVGGDGVSANTNTSGRSGVYATTGTTGAWGVFAAHSGGGQALQASAAPTSASGKPVAAVNNDGTGMALKASGNPAVSAHATSNVNPAVVAEAENGGLALQGNTAGSVAVRVTGGGFEALGTTTGTNGLRVEDHDVGLDADQCRLVNLRLRPTVLGPPPARTVAAYRGDVVNDGTDLWCCVTSGTPGTWRKVGGPQTAGALHVLPVPVRVYDSWPGQYPATVGPKGELDGGVPRVVDLTQNSSGVPIGATAAIVTLSYWSDPTDGNGTAILTAPGVTIPITTPPLVSYSAGEIGKATTIVALDTLARLQVLTSTDSQVQVDVIAYYR